MDSGALEQPAHKCPFPWQTHATAGCNIPSSAANLPSMLRWSRKFLHGPMVLDRGDKSSCMGWQDHYKTLAFKTLAFWQLVIEQYNARFIIKVDDDNYVRLDRLAIAVRQWEDIGAGAVPFLVGPAFT